MEEWIDGAVLDAQNDGDQDDYRPHGRVCTRAHPRVFAFAREQADEVAARAARQYANIQVLAITSTTACVQKQ
jgi:hypothetical protein